MKQLFALVALIVTMSFNAHAVTVPVYRDFKPASQAMLEEQTILAPMVATTNAVLATNAGPTSAAALTVTSFSAQPDVPRNLTITPTGTTGDVEACVITVTGTNFFGRSITETFTFIADASTAQTGNKAFKTVTSIAWPASCESGTFAATWIVGVGSKLGVKRCAADAGKYAWSVFDGAYETTRGTFAADVDEVEKNTFIPNGTMNDVKNVELFFVQNFACLP